MPPTNLQQELEESIGTLKIDTGLLHKIVHGPEVGPDSLIAVENGELKSLQRLQNEIVDAFNSNNVLAQVTDLKNDAEAAAIAAEQARDQAIAAAIIPGPTDAGKYRKANATGTGDEYSDLPVASTSTSGITLFATPAEVKAGIVGKAVDPAGLASLEAVDQVARNDVSVLALLRAADHQAGLQNFQDMIADKFIDTTGVDIGSQGGVLNGYPATSGSHNQGTSPWVGFKYVPSSSNPLDKIGLFVVGSFVGQDIRIETDNNGAPSTVLAHPNAEIVNCNGVAGQLNEWSFTGLVSLVAGKTYWIVISRNSSGNYAVARVTSGGGLEVIYHSGAPSVGYAIGYTMTYKDTPGLSSNVYYSDTQKCFVNRAVTKVPAATGTPVGTMTSGGGLANAFTGTNFKNTTSNGGTAPWGSGTVTLGKDWGFGNLKTAYKVRLFGTADRGFSNDGNWNTAVGSISLNSGPDLSTPTELAKLTGIDNSKMPGRFVDLVTETFIPARVLWVASVGFAYFTIGEMQIFEVSGPANMELISKPFVASYVPAKAALLALIQNIDPVIWNTDVKLWITRDGMATWVQVPMAYIGDFNALQKIFTGNGTMTGGAQALMHWKITSHNLKEIRVGGASLMWRP